MLASTICPTVPAKVTKMLLNRYRESGTQKSVMI